MTVTLDVLADELAVCRLPADAAVAVPPAPAALYSVTRTADEVSVVCPATLAPAASTVEAGWRALRVRGPLDFTLTGVLAAIADPLAAAGIPIFALSTYDTDYVLVAAADLPATVDTLRAAGHTVDAS
ncbi:MAG: ACT domain-containing protein [Streptosporangiales bacterium]|nr:ACT domain-containing protein [Streptosporangiales bacterium]